jgi:hypothetical protein
MGTGKSTQVFSVKVAEATTAGGDADANFLPDVSAAGSFVSMATTTATVDAFAGEEAMHMEDQGRRTPGENRPAAIGVINGSASAKFGAAAGEFIRAFYPDEIALAHRLRTPNGASPTTTGFGKVINSSMGLYSPTAATVTLAANSTGAGEFVVADGDASHVKIGAPVRVYTDASGTDTHVHEYAIVTESSSDGTNTTFKVHPQFNHTPQQNDVVQLCYAFYPVIGAGDTTLSNDIHCVFDMGGVGADASVRRIASGCRCTSFGITNDNFGASLSMSIRPMVMLEDDGNASTVTVSEPSGKLLQHRFGCRVDLGADHGGVAAGTAASGARTYMPNYDHSIEVSFDTAPGTPDTRGVFKGLSHEILNATCNVTVTTEKDLTLQRLIAKDELRTLIIGYGPGGSGSTNGNGAAFILKNASRADGSANPQGGEGNRITQQTVLRAVADFSAYAGTITDTEDLNLASAPFIFVLPKSS